MFSLAAGAAYSQIGEQDVGRRISGGEPEMYGWLDYRARHHAEELREEAERSHLARALRDAGRRNERRAGWRFAHQRTGWIMDLVRETLAGKGILEQPACEECLSK